MFGVVLTGCKKGERTSSNNNEIKQSNSNNAATQNAPVSDKQKVINYLKLFGTTDSYYIDTSSSSALGYSSTEDEFIVINSAYTSNLYSTGLYMISYSSNIGYGMHIVEKDGVTVFKCWNYVQITSHQYSYLDISSVEINYYSSNAAETLAAIIIATAQKAFNDASQYLYSHDLPFIY